MPIDETPYTRRALLLALQSVRDADCRGALDRSHGYMLGLQHGLLMAGRITEAEHERLLALSNNAARHVAAQLITKVFEGMIRG